MKNKITWQMLRQMTFSDSFFFFDYNFALDDLCFFQWLAVWMAVWNSIPISRLEVMSFHAIVRVFCRKWSIYHFTSLTKNQRDQQTLSQANSHIHLKFIHVFIISHFRFKFNLTYASDSDCERQLVLLFGKVVYLAI